VWNTGKMRNALLHANAPPPRSRTPCQYLSI
jgi:hypothetical protein